MRQGPSGTQADFRRYSPERLPVHMRFAIDRGGTFTDVYAEVPPRLGGGFRVLKLLSEDLANYRDAPTEGIRRVLEDVTGTRCSPAPPPCS